MVMRVGRGLAYGGRLAQALSPTGSWDADGVADAVHGWIERRRLRTGALPAAFDHASAGAPVPALARAQLPPLPGERARARRD